MSKNNENTPYYTGNAKFSPIPLTVSSPQIKAENKGKIKASAVETMQKQAKQQIDMLKKQAETIMEQVQQIEDRLRGHHPPTNDLVTNRASILIPLSLYRGEPSLLLTRRSAKLRSFSGHVSFPGGKRDQEDKSDYCTSLRESEEEVGLEQEQIRFVGELEQMLSPDGCLVSPFVARIPNQFEPKIN